MEDYPGSVRELNVVTDSLQGKGDGQGIRCQRRLKMLAAGSEDKELAYEPRRAGGLQRLQKARKWLLWNRHKKCNPGEALAISGILSSKM